MDAAAGRINAQITSLRPMHSQGQARPGQGSFVELWLAEPHAASYRRPLRVRGAAALPRVRRLWAREWVV